MQGTFGNIWVTFFNPVSGQTCFNIRTLIHGPKLILLLNSALVNID